MSMMTAWGMTLWMVVGAVLALAALVALVMGAVWLIRDLLRGRARQDESPTPTPREILEQRYAAGEIDDDELNRRTAKLTP